MAWDGVYTQQEIADMFGVCRENVSAIKRQKSWRHLWLRPEWTTPVVEQIEGE
jgi:transcriptional regulator